MIWFRHLISFWGVTPPPPPSGLRRERGEGGHTLFWIIVRDDPLYILSLPWGITPGHWYWERYHSKSRSNCWFFFEKSKKIIKVFLIFLLISAAGHWTKYVLVSPVVTSAHVHLQKDTTRWSSGFGVTPTPTMLAQIVFPFKATIFLIVMFARKKTRFFGSGEGRFYQAALRLLLPTKYHMHTHEQGPEPRRQ